MNTMLQERFWIARLHEKWRYLFMDACCHVKVPRIIPRSYGPTFAAEKRNEALHWDFMYLGDGYGYGDNTYLLVAKDELTHYCELIPCATPTAFVAAEGLSMWCARFGVPAMLISDQGTHFGAPERENEGGASFYAGYSPWINGTTELLNEDIVKVVRALLLAYDIATTEGPYLLPGLQVNLNFTPLQSVRGHSPVELFTGLPVSTPLNIAVGRRRVADDLRTINLDAVSEQLEELRSSNADLATDKGSLANFDVGDFVLWSRIDQRLLDNKILTQRIGPFKVIEARPHLFVIQYSVTGREYDVHCSRLKFYADLELNQTT
ncbi:LOW QUALITY PROTEIN: hypothetical protein PHMEG_00010057 [Phytophthora megakarya]|uniref:Integrase catalytic domain-containing protein n=1 Tax=Phytophthora megakarya TaxID=4795 RepID=A0A225WFK3_9STRA|nr:LOW QUALITY PROTEIN: hypothetical protein PHMEG_00010057 [Phytophthora megakarya]